MTVEPMIAVADVERSSDWYCRLLGCESAHGGPHFDRLCAPGGEVVLLLHHWNSEEHPSMSGDRPPAGVPGLELYFRVATLEELNAIYARAVELEGSVSGEPAFNPLSHQHEFRVRDLDGYIVTPCCAVEGED